MRANGETNPAIMTADEVNEPRNRRVEIIIEQ
jgi:outer membrane protein OmpA-like peptidoglycan-associated protein